LQAPLDAPIEPLLNIFLHFDGADAITAEPRQTSNDVANLAFDHKDDGIVREIGIGTVQHKKIRKTRNGHAKDTPPPRLSTVSRHLEPSVRQTLTRTGGRRRWSATGAGELFGRWLSQDPVLASP